MWYTHRPDLSAEILSHTTLIHSAIPLHAAVRKMRLEKAPGNPFSSLFSALSLVQLSSDFPKGWRLYNLLWQILSMFNCSQGGIFLCSVFSLWPPEVLVVITSPFHTQPRACLPFLYKPFHRLRRPWFPSPSTLKNKGIFWCCYFFRVSNNKLIHILQEGKSLSFTSFKSM